MDAIEEYIEKLSSACNTPRIHWEPTGSAGPEWNEAEGDEDEKFEGYYSYGAWWKLGNQLAESGPYTWAGVYAEWKLYDPLPDRFNVEHQPDIFRYSDGSGYIGYIEFLVGPKDSADSDSRETKVISFGKFAELLDEVKLPDCVKWICDGFEGDPVAQT